MYDTVRAKRCNPCNQILDLSEFNVCRSRKDGLSAVCRACNASASRRHRATNIDRYRERQRNYARRNAAQASERARRWRKENKKYDQFVKRAYWIENKERLREYIKVWKVENVGKVVALGRLREMRKRRAAPKWLTPVHLEMIETKYQLSAMLTETTGEKYNVDHIIPLAHPRVCGLHVPWNLQVITQTENFAKSNRFAD